MRTSHYQCNIALPTFNADGPFAMCLRAVILSIYLSVEQICRAGCYGSLQWRRGLCLYKPCEVPRPPRSYAHHTVVLLPLMINVSNVGLCRYEGHMVVQRYCCSKVPASISQTLVLFNVSTALRSLLIASSNPPACEAHACSCDKALCECVFQCVCVQDRLVWLSSHLVVTVTLDSKLVPVAKQPGLQSHQALPGINMCLKEREMREFGDMSKLTEIDWQFIRSVIVKNHFLQMAHFSKRNSERFPTSLLVVVFCSRRLCKQKHDCFLY